MGDPDILSPEEERLIAIAIAIADGTPVDWSDHPSESSALADSDQAALAPRLRELERIVRGHGAFLDSIEGGRSSESAPAAETLLTEMRRTGQVRPEQIVGVEWGPLIVLDKIGRGSFGDVYRAWDPRLEREVALKLVTDTSPRVSTPAFDEGRLLARVRHPNVVAVYGAERVNNRVGIWMEYVRGRTLADEIAERGPVSAEEAARIGIEVCRALSAVHEAGLLHRDVKAQNVMRDQEGRIVLGDFGTGVVFDENASLGEAQIAGTPLYLAPEILSGQRPSAATDVYSVGVLLYFMVTGQYPTRGRTLKELRRAHEAGNRVPLRQARPDLPSDCIDIVDALIEPGPDRRYGSAASAEAALTAWLSGTSVRAVRPTISQRLRRQPMLAAGILLAGVAVASVLTPVVRGRLDSWRRGIFMGGDSAISRQIKSASCSGSPSADGRWVACVESFLSYRARGAKNRALVVFSPDSGETKILKQPELGNERIIAGIVSPDGASVVFVLGKRGKPTEIRAIGADGKGERLILTVPDNLEGIGLNSWSDQDQRIAARLIRKDGSQALALLTPASGTLDVVFEFKEIPQLFHRSPDGQYLAYDVVQTAGAPERDIRVCDLSSGACETAVSHPANDMAPMWAPDGRLLFASDRAGTMGLWAVDLAGVRSAASPQLIRDTGRSPLIPRGFGGGIFFYELRVDEFDVYRASLGDSPDQLAVPVRFSPRAVDANRSPVWSPDGRSVAYVSRRGPFTESGGMRLVIQAVADGREREFRYDLPANMTRLAWSPDGKRIAMRTIKGRTLTEGTFGIHVVDAGNGQFLTSLRRQNPSEESVEEQIIDLAWIDNNTILFASKGGLGTFDITSGQERRVWSAPEQTAVFGMAMSPDSHWTAVLSTDSNSTQWIATVVPSSGGDARELFSVKSPETLWVQSWTADGQSVLVTRWDNSQPYTSRREQLWKLPVDGTNPSPLPLALAGLSELRVHPDGRRLAFTAGAPTSEFWIMTGLTK